MKGQCNSKPDSQLKSRGKTQVLYNIIQKDVTDAQTGVARTIWEYDYVEVEGEVTKAKVTAAMQKEQNDTTTSIQPDVIAVKLTSAKNELTLSAIANLTYPQVDTYIDANVTDMPSAKVYLKKLSRVVLALVKSQT